MIAAPLHAATLEAHWTFNQVGLSSGDTAADGSGLGRDATLQGSATTVSGGQLGGALSLNGTAGTRAEAIGYPGVTGNSARSISAWIRTAGNSPVQNAIISWGQNNSLERWTVRTDTTGAGGQSLRAEFGNAAIHDNEAITLFDQQFHHVAVTVPTDGTRADHTLYIDGEEITTVAILGSQSGSINTNALKDVLIGERTRDDGGGGTLDDIPFNGLIDDAAIFSEQLTSEEVSAIVDLALEEELQYDVGQANQLFELNDAGSGSVLIDGILWAFAPLLDSGGDLGRVVGEDGRFLLQLDDSGSLVGAQIPEPATLAIWLLLGSTAAVIVWRRRKIA